MHKPLEELSPEDIEKMTHEEFGQLVDDIGGICFDCGRDTFKLREYYMVRDSLWRKAKGGGSMLCITHLERRIGRKLNYTDFTLCRLNAENLLCEEESSKKLFDRMNRHP